MKKQLRHCLRHARPAAYRTGSRLLRFVPIQRVFNVAYENLGQSFQNSFNLIFDGSTIRRDFLWQCQLGGASWKMPVYPALRRSWSNARVWHWDGNRAVRAFYEFYLSQHPTGVLLDIGANDGTHSYPFAASGYQCVAFEPQPSCGDFIGRAIKANGFDMTLVCGVVGENEGEVSFYVSPSSWYSSLSRDHVEQFEESHAITVQCYAVDRYCAEHQLAPTFVKIDVEGHESAVLAGGAATFSQHKPTAFIEIANDADKRRFIWDFFVSRGYRTYLMRHYPERFSPINSLDEFLAAECKERNADFIFLHDTDLIEKFENWCKQFAL